MRSESEAEKSRVKRHARAERVDMFVRNEDYAEWKGVSNVQLWS
jgi:tRNA threonylcarbamoyladenosine modification (KEOPS) complex  Pcc1 subunit